MSIPKKTHQTVRQNGELVKKSHKHDANLQKNSTLYFQIGLIVCLLTAYGLLEMRFDEKSVVIDDYVYLEDELTEVDVPIFKIYQEPLKEPEPELKKVVLTDDPIIVDDDTVMKKTLDIITPDNNTSSDPNLDPSSLDVYTPPEEVNVPFNKIEVAPIYPGCEKKRTNADRKKCMSDKITKLVSRRFNTDLADELGLSGVQKIKVYFKINKEGNVTDIKTFAPHKKLENEAERLVNKIPKMIPGKQHNKNVGVIYQLPIIFRANN